MFRSIFGDPKPANPAELAEAMAEKDIDADIAQAMVHPPEEGASAPFIGWTAEILPTDDRGENGMETAGWEDRDALVAALRRMGITQIEDENGDPI